MSLLKPQRFESSKVLEYAKGKSCRLMLAPQCGSIETVVPCHIQSPGHGGMGTKPSDVFTVPGCDLCHAVLDGRAKTDMTKEFIEQIASRAHHRYLQELFEAGLVIMKGQR